MLRGVENTLARKFSKRFLSGVLDEQNLVVGVPVDVHEKRRNRNSESELNALIAAARTFP